MRIELANRLVNLAAFVVFASGSTGLASLPSENEAVAELHRYLSACCRNVGMSHHDCEDCTQDVLLYLQDRIGRGWLPTAIRCRDSAEFRELKCVVQTLVKRWQRARSFVSVCDYMVPVECDSEVESCHPGWDEVKSVARQTLSPRQFRVLDMSAQGHRASEIASALNLSAKQVHDTKNKAIGRLRRHFHVA